MHIQYIIFNLNDPSHAGLMHNPRYGFYNNTIIYRYEFNLVAIHSNAGLDEQIVFVIAHVCATYSCEVKSVGLSGLHQASCVT